MELLEPSSTHQCQLSPALNTFLGSSASPPPAPRPRGKLLVRDELAGPCLAAPWAPEGRDWGGSSRGILWDSLDSSVNFTLDKYVTFRGQFLALLYLPQKRAEEDGVQAPKPGRRGAVIQEVRQTDTPRGLRPFPRPRLGLAPASSLTASVVSQAPSCQSALCTRHGHRHGHREPALTPGKGCAAPARPALPLLAPAVPGRLPRRSAQQR